MGMELLTDILIIFSLSVAVLYICNRLNVPTIVGFLISGLIAGPHGLGLIGVEKEVEVLAEIGVVLLLFTIGIELSFAKLLQIRKSVLIGGTVQVLLTILITFLIASRLGYESGKSVFLGFLISLSSTAIVLKLIQERAEIDSPYGRTALGILIFQDVIIVPMVLVTPLLSATKGIEGESLVMILLKGVGILLFVVVSARYIVPRVLYQIVRTRSREVFLLSVLVICLAVAWATSSAGFSLSIGAFLAGLIISESEYSHEALSNILPFRDVFTSFFFISIGMLLNIDFVFQQTLVVLLIAFGVLSVKTVIAGLAAVLLGLPLRACILVGLALCQVGEFSFILSETGIEYGLFDEDTYQMFLSVSVLTMLVTPFMILYAPRLADRVLRLPIPEKLRLGLYPVINAQVNAKKDHLIIIGFGLNGKNIARAATAAGIPYVVIEMNPDTVKRERAKGEPIYYGDATRETILKEADIESARVVVSVISDPVGNRSIVELARRLNPEAYIVSRTRYVNEVNPLYGLGADEVVPEEFETSIEIFTRVLEKYLVPRDNIESLIGEVRSDGYKMFRAYRSDALSASDFKIQLPEVKISVLTVDDSSPLAGNSLAGMRIRSRYGVMIVAVRRDSQVTANPDSSMRIQVGDDLFVMGDPDKISEFDRLVVNPKENAT
jgi:CPA2 family monovalent cation:H+ antiporter-2